MKKIPKKIGGFTLIELLVVVAIIGILAAVVIASLNVARKRGRDAQRIRDVQEIHNAIELYISANGHPPDLGNPNCIDPTIDPSLNNCTANETPGNIDNWNVLETQLSPYISKLSKDPCGLKCFDLDNPIYNNRGFFTYTYEAPLAVQSLMIAKGEPLSSLFYSIFAQNLESKNNTSFGFNYNSQ